MEQTQDPVTTESGQVDAGTDASQTTSEAPVSGDGQSSGAETGKGEGTTSTGPGTQEDSFFDPKELDPALIPAYKQMQSAFTKKMQGISSNKQKIEAFEIFERDPVGTMQQIAKQYGYDFVRPGEQTQQKQQTENWEPQTWDDVFSRAKDMAKAEIMKEMAPVFDEFRNVKKSNIEKQLAEIDPTWQQYEDEMKVTLQEHPSLAKDPVKLYRLSVPEDVLMSKATQNALKKLQDKANAGQVKGYSTTTQKHKVDFDRNMTFSEAVEAARARLAEQGIRPL
jgi:hypothetical protein